MDVAKLSHSNGGLYNPFPQLRPSLLLTALHLDLSQFNNNWRNFMCSEYNDCSYACPCWLLRHCYIVHRRVF